MESGIIELLQTAYALYGAGGVIAAGLGFLIWSRLSPAVKERVRVALRGGR